MKHYYLFAILLLLFFNACAILAPETTQQPVTKNPKATLTITATPEATITSSPTSTPTVATTPSPSATLLAPRIAQEKAFLLYNDAGSETLKWSTGSDLLFVGTHRRGLLVFDIFKRELVDSIGEGEYISALDFSPDGEWVAIGFASDNGILLSSLTEPLSHWISPAHTNLLKSLEFDPESKWLVSCGLDGKIYRWDVETGKLINTLYEDWCSDLAVTPDGRFLVAGFGLDNIFLIWDTQTWELAASFEGNQAEDIAISPDGNRMVSAGGGVHEARVYDFETGSLIYTLLGHPSWVYAVDYSPKGDLIATAGIGNSIYLWDASSGELLYDLYISFDDIKAIAFSPDGSMLAGAGANIWLWDLSSLETAGGTIVELDREKS